MTTRRRFVLVVSADRELRRILGRLVEELGLIALLFAHWRASFATLMDRADAVILDVDDVVSAFRVRVAGEPPEDDSPLVVLSRRDDVMHIAAQLGAVAGVRKPIDANHLLTTLSRIIEPEPRLSER